MRLFNFCDTKVLDYLDLSLSLSFHSMPKLGPVIARASLLIDVVAFVVVVAKAAKYWEKVILIMTNFQVNSI